MSPDDTRPSRLLRLDWDSRHFGWPVARLTGDRLDRNELAASLETARRTGVRLVYWFADPFLQPDASLMHRYTGLLADRRVTFRLDLPLPAAAAAPAGCELLDWPRGEPSDTLIALAMSAGNSSRFAADTRIPRDRFAALYETWVRRSTRREMADTVIIATRDAEPVGFVTGSLREFRASIGLFAVAESAQRRGIGSALLRAAAAWAAGAGASELDAVTQLGNQPAVRCYSRHGFRQVELQHVFHFWTGEKTA
jgi:ribosomal protein S18 acetylase RimI-like enzyme